MPAFGLLPELASGNGFNQLFNEPRFWPALILSIKTGVIATLLVLLITLFTLICVYGTRLWQWLFAWIPSLLAVPHAAMAVGLAFMLAPSGWLARWVSPGISGWERPPADWVVPDAHGWSLIFGLVVKEAPFLLLTAAAQLQSINVDASLRIGRTLGYAPARCWSRLILPQLYPRIRLMLMVILAFNFSVVDMAIILGPGNPPTFSVLLMSLINDPSSRAAASAGALFMAFGLVLLFVVLWLLERLIAGIASGRRESGQRWVGHILWRRFYSAFIAAFFALSSISIVLLVIWSVAQRWRFPAVFPTQYTSRFWLGKVDQLTSPAVLTLSFALFTVVSVLVAAIAWLESERRGIVPKLDWLWYVPLLIPQVTLLFGLQAASLLFFIDGKWLTVAYIHWFYAMPYAVLILAVAWREIDPNWHSAAAVLGAGYWTILFRVRIPMLIRPIAQAAAVALAVSVAQYLPTLLLGAGRYQTLAIDLVTSFGGVDKRAIAVLAVLQSLLPLLAFVLALLVPRLVFRSRLAH